MPRKNKNGHKTNRVINALFSPRIRTDIKENKPIRYPIQNKGEKM